MKIAYILNTYPQPSHSFIRREIHAIEAQGHSISRIAMRAHDGPLPDAQDRAEQDKTSYVLRQGAMALLGATLNRFRHSPRQWFGGLRLALSTGRRSEVGVLRHLIYFAEGCFVASTCRNAGITHAHAHFGTNAASVAMFSRVVGGPSYSFTVHGPEEFDSPRALSLQDKISRAAFTVAISSFGRSQLCRWADASDWNRIKVVHCGIERARFGAIAPMPDGPLRLVCIGRLVEQKGQLALIEALAQVPEAHLTLIGNGEMRPQIEAAIALNDLTDRVTLTGMVDETGVRAELDAAHALVMPSFAEGLPMVVMEAMAAGRPVIATYIAGTPELVQQDKTGWLVPAGDVDALAQAMSACGETPVSQRTAMGKAARVRVFARHDVKEEAAKLAVLMQGWVTD